MIHIGQPAMGLNSSHDHHIHVQMWNTWDVASSKTASDIVEWVRRVAIDAPGGKLKNVVFSCHGAPARIGIGRGIGLADVPLFGRWVNNGTPLVEKIWLRCCQVALIPGSGSPGSAGCAAGGDGNVFCSELAKAARCYVVASTELQIGTVGRILPFGRIDTFEGLVLSYGPGGDVTWSNRYRSGWQRSDGNWTQNPD